MRIYVMFRTFAPEYNMNEESLFVSESLFKQKH